jgi:tetratricopeptide (TPR) repeat protein
MYQATCNQPGQALALNAVGWCHALLGDHRQALTVCQHALTLHQNLGNRAGQAATWDSIGYAHHHLGHHTHALTSYHHALTLYRDLGDRHGEATVLTRLGETHRATGNHHAAHDVWNQALTILNDLNHPMPTSSAPNSPPSTVAGNNRANQGFALGPGRFSEDSAEAARRFLDAWSVPPERSTGFAGPSSRARHGSAA